MSTSNLTVDVRSYSVRTTNRKKCQMANSERSQLRTARTANGPNNEQSEQFLLSEQSEHRIVHFERTVDIPKMIKSSEQSEQPLFCLLWPQPLTITNMGILLSYEIVIATHCDHIVIFLNQKSLFIDLFVVVSYNFMKSICPKL